MKHGKRVEWIRSFTTAVNALASIAAGRQCHNWPSRRRLRRTSIANKWQHINGWAKSFYIFSFFYLRYVTIDFILLSPNKFSHCLHISNDVNFIFITIVLFPQLQSSSFLLSGQIGVAKKCGKCDDGGDGNYGTCSSSSSSITKIYQNNTFQWTNNERM